MSDTVKHTPGPWMVDVDIGGMFEIRRLRAGGPCFRIADIYGDPCDEANARLIAAAPDLLDALRESLRLFDAWNCPIAEKCRAAIAKATGGRESAKSQAVL